VAECGMSHAPSLVVSVALNLLDVLHLQQAGSLKASLRTAEPRTRLHHTHVQFAAPYIWRAGLCTC
jgi:hypothetical protein